MKRVPHILAACVFAGAAMAPGTALAACDPYAKSLDVARTLIIAKKYPEALAKIEAVLVLDPKDFRANYQKGLVIVDQADLADLDRRSLSPDFVRGVSLLIDKSKRLGQIEIKCAKSKTYYAIYSAIGTEYLGRARYDLAREYLLKAYEAREYLSPVANLPVLEYLGQVDLILKKFSEAHTFYSRALKAGSTVAARQLQIVDALGKAAQFTDPKVTASATHPNLTGSDPHWVLDKTANCWTFDSYPTHGETASWSGACVNGVATGPGAVSWGLNGKVVETRVGEYANGSLNGHGIATGADGSRYEGDWVYSMRQGYGVLKLGNGDVYDGYWPGRGRYTRANGEICDMTANRKAGSDLVRLTPSSCKRP